MEKENKPKKRGRKPKNVKKEEVKEVKQNIKENLIIHLKKTDVDDYNIQSFNKDENENETVNQDNTKCQLCWNCCHKFDEHIYGIPMKYIDGIFYIYGNFCSLECASRYAHDNLHGYDFSEIYSLINLYSNIIFDEKKEIIKLAPNRLMLDVFGGPLTIDEYRSNTNSYEIRIPPILPIKHTVNKYELNKTSNKNMLKLYRKNPLQSEKKSITSTMNLIINSQE